MTVTDELLAEIAQELNRCKFSDDDDGDESWPSISGEAVSALTTELRRLRAENAELAKDARRYRFARKLENDCFMLNTLQRVSGNELDTAIDTAMQAAQ